MNKREQYDSYDAHLKVNRAKRHVLEVGVAAIVKALSDSGVSWSPGKEPMSDVCAVHLTFRADGDFRSPEVTITSQEGGCYSVVCLEPTRAEEIADEMVDAVIHDNDLLDLDRGVVEAAKADLASALAEPLEKEGEALFTKEFVETFAIGEDTDVDAIVAAHPCLKPANELLEKFFEEAS